MANLNETKYSSMLTVTGLSSGQMNEVEHAYLDNYSATANTELNEKWLEVALANGASSTNWNQAILEFLAGQGHSTGTINERWLSFWVAGGAIV